MPARLPILFAIILLPWVALAQPREFRDCRDCPLMVAIPPGAFTMGADVAEEARENLAPDLRGRSAPPTRITLSRGFAIGKFPITRAEFLAFAQSTNRVPGLSCWGLAPQPDGSGRWQERQRLTWASPGFGQTPQDPAVCVSWADAAAYGEWLSRRTGRRYRLPSEAEWEFAARAGTTGPRYWTAEAAETCAHANVRDHSVADFYRAPRDASFFPCSDGVVHTARVGAFPANPFGLHDMLGNVWQWTQDCWNPTLQGQPRTGAARETGDCLTRTARGGSWSNDPRFLRVAYRSSGAATVRSSNTGFRLVRSD
ncbi:formylglycine-generating enzyme family protein [Roseomonas sp. CECT 9278]|uniref:formylglycine-generating enzyme family protein n=1 Tax=Roseomonas sp. CECT 9278 TaxID=2845823 RepID=UPI001E4E4B31|nr:formylglycine-generating enzyme family protein [Roseomonas sp. CECT 9278]CAH0238351.1 Formylglycine-generating enzyme [Roseomonas sp. CECT 9278]